jgi:hypothetical protein
MAQHITYAGAHGVLDFRLSDCSCICATQPSTLVLRIYNYYKYLTQFAVQRIDPHLATNVAGSNPIKSRTKLKGLCFIETSCCYNYGLGSPKHFCDAIECRASTELFPRGSKIIFFAFCFIHKQDRYRPVSRLL